MKKRTSSYQGVQNACKNGCLGLTMAVSSRPHFKKEFLLFLIMNVKGDLIDHKWNDSILWCTLNKQFGGVGNQ